MSDADSQKSQRFPEGRFEQQGMGRAETNVTSAPIRLQHDRVIEFYNRWAMWIPMEGRAAFLEQLRELVQR